MAILWIAIGFVLGVSTLVVASCCAAPGKDDAFVKEDEKSLPAKTISFEHKQSRDTIFLPWMLIHDWANINRIKKRYEEHGKIIVELPDGEYKYSKHEVRPVSELMEIVTIYLERTKNE